MKNKKTIYLLLLLVLGIWGMIIYQIFSYSNTNEEVVLKENFSLLPEINYKEPDTSSINTDYRDPFSGTLQNSKVEIVRTTPSNENYSIPSEVANETVITYKGIVSDSNDKIKVFMVIIDGTTYLMKQGDLEGGVTLIKGNRSTITVKHKGKLNTLSIVD